MRDKHREGSARRTITLFTSITALLFSAVTGMTNPVQAQQRSTMQFSREDTNKSAGDVNSKVDKKSGDVKADSKIDPTELARQISALEDRIRELENRLAKTASSTAAAKVDPVKIDPTRIDEISDLKKEVATIQEETKKNSGFTGFFRDVELSGLVDGYYSYNFNRPDGQINTGRAFDTRDNTFSLNLAKITLEKKNDLTSPLGFRLDLAFGPTIDIVNGPNPSGGDAIRHVQQAYVSYVAPVGSGLTVDFGKFVTPAGAEVIETKDNYNYTRGYLFSYAIPFSHTGLRAKYSVNSKVSVTGFLLNGWDNFTDNNTGKTVGVSVGLTPSSRFSITSTYLGGPEQTSDNKPKRHLSDTVVSFVANDKLTFLANYDYGADKLSTGQTGHWQGLAAYLRYSFNKRFAFSPRFEVFQDHDGFRTGLAQTLKGLTLTQEMKLVDNLITRFEYRRDWSDTDFFNKSVGRQVRGQNTFLIGVSYFISSRGQ